MILFTSLQSPDDFPVTRLRSPSFRRSSNANNVPSEQPLSTSSGQEPEKTIDHSAEFEIRKVQLYGNCRRVRALIEVLIDKAKPHQLQNVSYILAQISIRESTGVTPTTEDDLKLVKQELNAINLEIFRLSLLVNQSHENTNRENHDVDPEKLLQTQNQTCSLVILKIIVRELTELESQLEAMHRKCRANRPKRSNQLKGGKKKHSRPYGPPRRNTCEDCRRLAQDTISKSMQEKIKQKNLECKFRTVTSELNLEKGILMILNRKRNLLIEEDQKNMTDQEKGLNELKQLEIEIMRIEGNEYDEELSFSTPQSNYDDIEYWRLYLSQNIGLTFEEYEKGLSMFISQLGDVVGIH